MSKRHNKPSAEVRIRVMKRDLFRCTYCGISGTDAELEVDHIIPVVRGGSNHMSNLTTACRKCNQEKGVNPAPEAHCERNGLLGLFLHILTDDGQVCYQGKIVGFSGDVVLVQLYEWIMGEASTIKPIPRIQILSDRCRLYGSAEEMRWAYERDHPEMETFPDCRERKQRINHGQSEAATTG